MEWSVWTLFRSARLHKLGWEMCSARHFRRCLATRALTIEASQLDERVAVIGALLLAHRHVFSAQGLQRLMATADAPAQPGRVDHRIDDAVQAIRALTNTDTATTNLDRADPCSPTFVALLRRH